jgi:hypothetical protein
MGVDAVLDQLRQACVRVWLDAAGKLRINKDAPAEWKDLVRAHKQELIDRLIEQSASGPATLQTGIQIYSGWAEWQAEMLNRLFQEQGCTGQRGRITPATIRHGQASRASHGKPSGQSPQDTCPDKRDTSTDKS